MSTKNDETKDDTAKTNDDKVTDTPSVVREGGIEVPVDSSQFHIGTPDDPNRALQIPH